MDRLPTPAAQALAGIAQAVLAERKRQGLDQQSLALAADVGVRSIHRIEHAEATVQLDIVLRVLTALGLRLEVARTETR